MRLRIVVQGVGLEFSDSSTQQKVLSVSRCGEPAAIPRPLLPPLWMPGDFPRYLDRIPESTRWHGGRRTRRLSSALVHRWLPPLLTAGFVMAGSYKGTAALSWLPFDLTLVLAAGTAAAVAVTAFRSGVPRQVHGIVAAFALLLPAALFTAGTEYGVDKAIKLFILTPLAILAPVVLIRTGKDAERHIKAWAIASGVIVVSALLNPVPDGDYLGAPIETDATDTIDLGLAAALVVVVMMMGLLWKRLPWLLAVPAGGAAVYVLLQSGSRGPLISVLLGVMAGVLLVRVRPSLTRSMFVIGLGTVGVIAAFQAAPYYSRLRITQLLLEGQVEGDTITRLRLFGVAWDSITQHPFGIGWGGYQEIAFLGYRYPHDLVLEVLVEAGVVLGGLFVIWIAVQVWKARSAATDFVSGTSFALLVLMLSAAAVTGDINDNRTLFYALGIAIAIGAVATQPAVESGTNRNAELHTL